MTQLKKQKWARLSLSSEVQNWMKCPDVSLYRYGSVTYFKNKVLVSASPYRARARTVEQMRVSDYAFGGFTVLELDNLVSYGEASSPVWAGLWTGVNPLDTVILRDSFL